MWSSMIFELAKFLPASTNVGRLPEKDVVGDKFCNSSPQLV